MIYITGDCHGDYRRFGSPVFPEQKVMTKDDYVIICGDFGFWDQSREQQYWRKWLSDKPFTTLWVDGNHENYDLLKEYPVEHFGGQGKVQFITPSIIHLMRGQVYDIDGFRFFTFGGASSHDISGGILEPDDPELARKKNRLKKEGVCYRINHVSWWKEELPSQEECEEGRRNLEAVGWDVDFIVTHCCSSSTQAKLAGDWYQADRMTDYLEEICKKTTYKKHFFGHYHDNRNVSDHQMLLYEQIVRIV